jgi:hypothetical protein
MLLERLTFPQLKVIHCRAAAIYALEPWVTLLDALINGPCPKLTRAILNRDGYRMETTDWRLDEARAWVRNGFVSKAEEDGLWKGSINRDYNFSFPKLPFYR